MENVFWSGGRGSSLSLSTIAKAPFTELLRLWKPSWEAGSFGVANCMSFYDLFAL